MSTYYLIPVGGTGARIMRAVLYMAAAHCFDSDSTIKVLCVDSDASNGDLGDLKESWNLYRRIAEKCTDIPKIEPVKYNAGESGIWSPLENTDETLQSMFKYNQMDKARDVVDFFFTPEEKSKTYNGGFYGHTSIGSYFMSKSILNEDGTYTAAWEKFFEGHEEGSKVFIVGSIFGGTGASAVPTLARIIKENIATKDMNLGAAFVMPYFYPNKLEDSSSSMQINGDVFSVKTKAAMSFYIDQKYIGAGTEDIFDCLYFIGENPENMIKVPNKDSGYDQKNKPHHIEILMATGVFDFFKSEKSESSILKLLCVNDDNKVDSLFLNRTSENKYYNKILAYTYFSVVYIKYMSQCISEGYSTDWKVGNYASINEDDNEDLKRFCCKYLKWFREISLTTNEDGYISYTDQNRQLDWLDATTEAVKDLYTENIISFDVDGVFKKHKKYHLDELDAISLIKKDLNLCTATDAIFKFSQMKCKNGNIMDLISNMLESIDL